MPPTHFHFLPLIKLLHTLLRSIFPFVLQQISERELVKVSLIFTANSGPLTQRLAQEDSRKSTSAISQVSVYLFQEIYEWSGKL